MEDNLGWAYVAVYKGNIMKIGSDKKVMEKYCKDYYYRLESVSIKDAVDFFWTEG